MKNIPVIPIRTASFLIAAVLLVSLPAFARSAAQEAERAARQEEKAAREAAKEARLEAKATAPVNVAEDDKAQAPMVATMQGRLIRIPTRQDVTVPVFWMPRAGASATVLLIPGGKGGLGRLVDGQPSGENFLVRSRQYFVDQGFNVAVVGRASDLEDLDYGYRTSKEHVGDLQKVVEAIKRESPLPVWMIGTSRGTISTAAAAITFGSEQLSGIVLTSSVTNHKITGGVPAQELGSIRIPTLVLHHEKDSCRVCRPHEVARIFSGLDHAPIKKQIMVSGGANPIGDPCEAQHYHGYFGMEKEAVATIAQWIKKPVN
jgi:pimeloyl-ACP methyl ester carboxylesterase